MKKEISS
ncbi:nef attachable domain protein, partial [Chlamydia psittaci C1/97]